MGSLSALVALAPAITIRRSSLNWYWASILLLVAILNYGVRCYTLRSIVISFNICVTFAMQACGRYCFSLWAYGINMDSVKVGLIRCVQLVYI